MSAQNGFADVSIAKTYKRLRVLIGVSLIVLPLLTAICSFFLVGGELEPSLSDYYFLVKDGGLPRTIFLIFLSFLGCALFSYRGFDGLDNRIHNLAGVFALGVAIFPMYCDIGKHPYCVPGVFYRAHLPSAGLLYCFAVISVIYSGGAGLKSALRKLPDFDRRILKLKRIKYVSLMLMTVGVVGFFVHKQNPEFGAEFSWIFWIEYAGFFGFGLYWLRLMLFIDSANKAGRKLQSLFTADAQVSQLREESSLKLRENQAPRLDVWQEIP